jgi:hypothetical protein
MTAAEIATAQRAARDWLQLNKLEGAAPAPAMAA